MALGEVVWEQCQQSLPWEGPSVTAPSRRGPPSQKLPEALGPVEGGQHQRREAESKWLHQNEPPRKAICGCPCPQALDAVPLTPSPARGQGLRTRAARPAERDRAILQGGSQQGGQAALFLRGSDRRPQTPLGGVGAAPAWPV